MLLSLTFTAVRDEERMQNSIKDSLFRRTNTATKENEKIGTTNNIEYNPIRVPVKNSIEKWNTVDNKPMENKGWSRMT
jgi:hypothetical protein